MKNDYQIIQLYEKIEELRKQVKNNEKAMIYYEYLKEINKKDIHYGWMFINDDILNDTLEDFEMYQNAYVRDILQVYKNELENILIKIEL